MNKTENFVKMVDEVETNCKIRKLNFNTAGELLGEANNYAEAEYLARKMKANFNGDIDDRCYSGFWRHFFNRFVETENCKRMVAEFGPELKDAIEGYKWVKIQENHPEVAKEMADLCKANEWIKAIKFRKNAYEQYKDEVVF